MTCRQKKIKCDKNKPKCHRCAHGQRDCTWPVGVEPRKRDPTKRVDSIHEVHPDVRPSNDSSSGISEGSTPPTRHQTPPKRELELDLPPLTLRRPGPSWSASPPSFNDLFGGTWASVQSSSRQLELTISPPPSSHHSNMSTSMMPDLSDLYLALPPVDQLYTPAPWQEFSSSAPLGGAPRVAQMSGSKHRFPAGTSSVYSSPVQFTCTHNHPTKK
ncbi:hypothetical protein BGY98DRAFT_534621 [Russula aff. rugulosa BPL654]|nr:hypothetical protein BGY98DRAFT_534621 [Russula aff. rugulosa BPL654]